MQYGSKLHIPPTNHYFLAAQQEPYKKAKLLTENVSEFSGKNQEFGPSAEKWQDRKSKRTSWKTREENGPEISDRERASDILGFPLGGQHPSFHLQCEMCIKTHTPYNTVLIHNKHSFNNSNSYTITKLYFSSRREKINHRNWSMECKNNQLVSCERQWMME